MFDDSPPPGASDMNSATPGIRPSLRQGQSHRERERVSMALGRDFQGTNVKLNETKMAATGAFIPDLVAYLLKTALSRQTFADKRE